MSNKQMTAVGYIIHELQCKFPKYMGDMYESNQLLLEDIVLKATELEKQQIIDAFWNGDNTDCTSEQDSKEFAKKYFKQTYEQ